MTDPLGYTTRALERLGSLVDVRGERASAVLPAALAARLGVPDELDLGVGLDGAVDCGLGSALLEALIEDGRAGTPLAVATASLLPPRESTVRAMGEAYPLRNGVGSVIDAGVAPASFLVAALAWAVEADERSEGLVIGAIDPGTGVRPGIELHSDPALADVEPSPRGPIDARRAADWVDRLAADLVDPALVPVVAATRRRHGREHVRIAEYYDQLVTEARRAKRKVDRAAIGAKVEHLLAERASRLDGLGHRYTVRVSVRPAALLLLTVSAGWVRLRVRRRKEERELRLTLPPGARSFDRFPCAGCGGWIATSPALCDDRLHLLCERCVPEAQGRPRCPACRTP